MMEHLARDRVRGPINTTLTASAAAADVLPVCVTSYLLKAEWAGRSYHAMKSFVQIHD